MMVMILNFFLSTDDANWNPVEWERAAEELTWERVRFLLFSQNQPHITPDYACMVIITKNTTFCTLAQTDTQNIT